MSDKKPFIIKSNLRTNLQIFAVDTAMKAFDISRFERDIAIYMRIQFDIKFRSVWDCKMGGGQGNAVAHEKRPFVYFSIGEVCILIIKTG